MSDHKKYVENRKKRDPAFAKNYDIGYNIFKFGVMLKQLREDAGLSQEQIAALLSTKKSAISRIENHSEDIQLSTLHKFAKATGHHLKLMVS